jgi:hypothetical protein
MLTIGNAQTGQVSVTREFAGNLQASNYFTPSPIEADFTGYPYGNWYKVPDTSVQGRRRSLVPFIGGIDYVWTLPNGTEILLSTNEVRFSDGSIWDYSTLREVSVKCTENTIPGLLAFNLISRPQLPAINERLRDERTNRQTAANRPTTQQAVISSANTLLVLAVVGAAIWFLPRNIVKG